MFFIQILIISLISFYEIIDANYEYYKRIPKRNISKTFSDAHLLSVTQPVFGQYCLIECNAIINCKTLRIETYNKISKCYLYDSIANSIDIQEISDINDIFVRRRKCFFMTLCIKFFKNFTQHFSCFYNNSKIHHENNHHHYDNYYYNHYYHDHHDHNYNFYNHK